MGKNYYIETKRHHCKCCDQRLPEPKDERIHIGKSSGGWAFQFRAYPEGIDWLQKEDPNTVLETVQCWREFMRRQVRDGAVIYDEYGKAIDLEDFWEKVEEKKGQKTVYDTNDPSRRSHPKNRDDYFIDEQCSFSSREFS